MCTVPFLLTGALLKQTLHSPLWLSCSPSQPKSLLPRFPIPYSFRGKCEKSDFYSPKAISFQQPATSMQPTQVSNRKFPFCPLSTLCSLSNCGILPAALHSFHSFHSERTFHGIVLMPTEAGPMETRSGFFVARGGASARKFPLQAGNGTGGPAGERRGIRGRSYQNSLLGAIANRA